MASLKGLDPETLRKNLVVLTGVNYKEWATKFTGLFSFLSLSSHIEMDLNCFDDPRWVETENDIKNLLVGFAEPKFHAFIQQSKTAAIAWDKLKAICEVDKTPYELFVQLDKFDLSEATGFSEMKQLVEEAEFLCDNLSMYHLPMGSEFHKKARLISALPDAFSELKQLMIPEMRNLDYETVKAKTLEFAKELAKQQMGVQNSVASLVKSVVLSVEKPNDHATNKSIQPSASQAPVDSSGDPPAQDPGAVTPSHNVLIVDAKSAQNFREIAAGNGKAPAIQDIRYMSPEMLQKELKQETGVVSAAISSTTPPRRRRKSESIERQPKRRDSPHRERRGERRHSKSIRDRSRDRKERSRNDSHSNTSQSNNATAGFPNVSINQNRVNSLLPSPNITADIEMFKNLQNFGFMSECNRVLAGDCPLLIKEG